MRLLTLSIVACYLLIACAGGPMPMPDEPIKVPPPANLTAPPKPLPMPDSGRVPDLESNHRETARAYHQLAAQLCNLLAFLEVNHDECRRYDSK